MGWTRRGPFFVHTLLPVCRSCERGRVAFVGLQQLAIWIVVRRREKALCNPTRLFHLRESAGRFLDAPGQPREERFSVLYLVCGRRLLLGAALSDAAIAALGARFSFCGGRECAAGPSRGCCWSGLTGSGSGAWRGEPALLF